ncbi:MAG: 4-hydroxy-tetrahydrodipicolinate synthase [Bacteroidales bacterium]|nr:4-hydroxy-tetrahydrodipicolinate synthase [Bacteroidales bacterium]MCF8389523.1 4-hydroxy-tetrahydrodipicolinate synthase [Bacteroidales bacterium]
MNLRGTGVALVTPFDKKGEIDFDSLEKLINHVVDGGVEYLVALGTTAETPTLSQEEKHEVVSAVIKYNANRLPVVLGMGSNNTHALVKEISKTDFTGIHAILSVAPYYNKPSQEGIYQHYREVSKASPLPVILYNVPGRTSSNISADTCLKLAKEYENIVAIKEASGVFSQIMEMISNKPKGFEVLSGDDALTFPMISLGATGVITVVGNAFPQEFSEMVRMALSHNIEDARTLHYKLIPIIDLIFAEGNPTGLKAFLNKAGICQNELRLPLVKASDALVHRIDQVLKAY